MSDVILNEETAPIAIEPCLEINTGEARAAEVAAESGVRSSSSTLLRDAPGCSTAVANGLSQQLIHQMNLILPNALVSFDDLKVDLGEAAFPFLQPAAKNALQRAIQDRGITLYINSAYRTIAQQLLLYNWGGGCGYPVVAPPGQSNHQSGVAIDVNDHQGWRPYLERHGWRWLGDYDPPHFDYVGGGTNDLRSTAMLAIQKLWNQNHPTQRISEDGSYGPQTESALNRSPLGGFAKAPWDEKPRILRLSRPRMTGSDVEKLQQALKKAGMAVDVDGVFGPGTDKAVKAFQQAQQLVADGIVGPKTYEKLA